MSVYSMSMSYLSFFCLYETFLNGCPAERARTESLSEKQRNELSFLRLFPVINHINN